MNKREIIEIVKALDHSPDCRSYYEFAHTYLRRMLIEGRTEPAEFWEMLRHCMKTADRQNTIKAMGKTGKGDPAAAKRWCSALLNRADLQRVPLDALCSIFGYCAHLGK